MATWQDLQRKQARSAAAAPSARGADSPFSLGAASPLAPGAAAAVPSVAAVAPATASSPRLQALMAERQRLEGRMSSLVGAADGRDAARFSVAPAAQRRAEAQHWLAQREAGREALSSRRLAQRSRSEEPARLASTPSRDAAEVPEPGTPTSPSAWSHLRDTRQGAQRALRAVDQALASTDALDGRKLDRALDSALDRQPSLSTEDRARAKSQARDALSGAAAPLRGALDEPKRKVQEVSQRARDALAAGERIERDWQRRRDAIGGPDLNRVAQSYEQRRHRLLEVATGSVAQLAERMDGLRQVLQQRRADHKAQEREDEARRERALERRQQRRQEEGSTA